LERLTGGQVLDRQIAVLAQAAPRGLRTGERRPRHRNAGILARVACHMPTTPNVRLAEDCWLIT